MKPYLEYSNPRQLAPQVLGIEIEGKLQGMNPRLIQPAMALLQKACKRGKWQVSTRTEYVAAPICKPIGYYSLITARRIE